MRINLTKTPQVIFFILFLPVLSGLIVLIVNWLLRPLSNKWFFPFIDTLGLIGVYGLLYSIFDKYCWKHRIFKTLKIVDFPDLEGRWGGYITSSFNKRQTKYSATLEIEQTFSNIKICVYCEHSSSVSLMAEFVKAPNGRLELHYEYHNEPKETAVDTMHGHDGVVRLVYSERKNTLTGSYYNSSQHDRGNLGTLEFKLGGKKLKRNLD